MSGPMAAGYGIEAAVLVSAGAILEGIGEIAADLQQADRQAATRIEQRHAAQQQMREARQAGLAKRQQQAEARTARLRRLQEALTAPVPADGNVTDLAALVAAGAAAQARLATYLAGAQRTEIAAEPAAARRALIADALGHLQLSPDETPPEGFARLANDIVQASTEARAAALATELRRQVQAWNADRQAAVEEARRRAAATIVLEQSLRDLGYAVDDIEETLFVEGGVAHFQRPEWGDYFVRLRIDPSRNAMNFNVVRAGTTGDDRRHADMLAEERWCSDFPRLFDTLKARGIPIEVTRLLQAGEAPVQIVDAASLPDHPDEDRRDAPPQARSLP